MSDPQGPELTRLATYGTLSPGQINHHELAGLQGTWHKGTVRGRLTDSGWGSALGFPALLLDGDGPLLEVHLLESPDLPYHWPRLDEFEGSAYRRVVTQVSTPDADVAACIYVLAARSRAVVHEKAIMKESS